MKARKFPHHNGNRFSVNVSHLCGGCFSVNILYLFFYDDPPKRFSSLNVRVLTNISSVHIFRACGNSTVLSGNLVGQKK